MIEKKTGKKKNIPSNKLFFFCPLEKASKKRNGGFPKSHALAARGESLGPTAIEGIAANAHAGALSHASDSGLMNSLQQGHN